MNLSPNQIIVNKPILGLEALNLTYTKCTTLAEVLAAIVAAASVQEIYAVSGVYDNAAESIIITLSNNSTFSIPAALLLPVVSDGTTIIGNGTTADPLKGYAVALDPESGALIITTPDGITNLFPNCCPVAPTVLPGALATLNDAIFNIPNPLPVAAFAQTSKIGLTAGFDAAGSSGTQDGNILTYAWSAAPYPGTTGAVTFDAPDAQAVKVTCSTPGQYAITLTVTDTNGNSHAITQTINVARLLHVGSDDAAENNYFATVAEAFAWKAANDPANTYGIVVHSPTVETVTLTNPDRAHVHYEAGAVSTYQAVTAYSWTVSPVDFKLTGTTDDPYSPAIIIDGGTNTNAFNATAIDAINLHISNIAGSRIAGTPGGRPLNFIDVNNLHLTSIGVRTTNQSSVYNAFFQNCPNLAIIDSKSVGDGISWGISSPNGVAKNRLVNLYGELSATPQANASTALYIPGVTSSTVVNDILILNPSLVNYAVGKDIAGNDRAPVFIGGNNITRLTGVRIVGGSLVQMVAGLPAIRSVSAQADRNTLHLLGTAISGGGFQNCAPDPAGTVIVNNAQLT